MKHLHHFFIQLYIMCMENFMGHFYLKGALYTFFKIMFFCESQALFQLLWYRECYTCALLLALARASTVARDVFNK